VAATSAFERRRGTPTAAGAIAGRLGRARGCVGVFDSVVISVGRCPSPQLFPSLPCPPECLANGGSVVYARLRVETLALQNRVHGLLPLEHGNGSSPYTTCRSGSGDTFLRAAARITSFDATTSRMITQVSNAHSNAHTACSGRQLFAGWLVCLFVACQGFRSGCVALGDQSRGRF